MTTNNSIVLAAGGTGGHLFPAEALAKELIARGCEVTLITDQRAKDFSGKAQGINVEHLNLSKRGSGLLTKIVLVWKLPSAILHARRLLKNINPSAVVGFGSYVSVPTILASYSLNIPIALHCADAIIGRANRFLARITSATVATSFQKTEKIPAKSPVVFVGLPVRPAIAAKANSPYPSIDGKFTIFITAGSQGAKSFGEVIPKAIELLKPSLRNRLHIVQQARPENIEAVKSAYKAIGADADVQTFFHDMPERIAASHLVICRSGASTITELMTIGRPAICVPHPTVPDDHQAANAEAALVSKGGGWMMRQSSFTPENLARRLEELLTKPQILSQAAAAVQSDIGIYAGQKLAEAVLAKATLR